MTAWTDFVMKMMNEKRKTNKAYSYKEAMVEASKLKRQGKMGSTDSMSKKASKGKKGGATYGSPLSPASLPLSPQYDGIDGQGITQGTGQSGPLTAALTASGGARKRGTKSRRSSKRRGKKSGKKTRRHRKK